MYIHDMYTCVHMYTHVFIDMCVSTLYFIVKLLTGIKAEFLHFGL